MKGFPEIKCFTSGSALGRPRQGLLAFHWTTEALKDESPAPRPPPIAASLILPAIFWGQNYVSVRTPYLISFFDLFFLLFYSYSSLLFNFFLFISAHLYLLISSYSSCTILRVLILLFLYFKLFVVLQTCILIL